MPAIADELATPHPITPDEAIVRAAVAELARLRTAQDESTRRWRAVAATLEHMTPDETVPARQDLAAREQHQRELDAQITQLARQITGPTPTWPGGWLHAHPYRFLWAGMWRSREEAVAALPAEDSSYAHALRVLWSPVSIDQYDWLALDHDGWRRYAQLAPQA